MMDNTALVGREHVRKSYKFDEQGESLRIK